MFVSLYFMTYFRAAISTIASRVRTGHNCRQFVCSELRTSAQHARNSPIVTVTVEREQLIGHAPHENGDIHTLSMT